MSHIKIETGSLLTPSGEPYRGFKVTVGGQLDPTSVQRTYDDIEAILKANKTAYTTHETKTSSGTFRSYSVSTG